MAGGDVHPWGCSLAFARVGLGGAAGLASIGAGTIHAAATLAHRAVAPALAIFVVLAGCQLVWGALVLARSGRRLILSGALGNLAAVAGWIASKTVGIGPVRGLEHAASPQLADSLAALLAAFAVACTVAALARARGGISHPVFGPAATAPLAVLIAAAAAGATAAPGHAHDAARASHRAQPAHRSAHGVAGVSAVQQARADRLVRVTRRGLPRFSRVAAAKAAGYASIGDSATGYEHYIKWSYIDDDRLLDPKHAESLVYRVNGDRRRLVAAMYMLREGATLDRVPDVGGRLTQWHVHDDLCFTADPAAPVVGGITTPGGRCPAPLVKRARVPMLHVWIVAHECGPFASLEGIAAGQVREGEQRRCDRRHATH